MEQNNRILSKEIHRLDNRIRRCLHQTAVHRELESLSSSNGHIIRFLCRYPDRPIYQKDLEDELGITRSTASRVVRLMEENGLIRREGVEHDARLKRLILTERSLALSEAMRQNGQAVDRRLLSGFTSEEEAQLYGFLDRMLENISDSTQEERP